MLTPVSSRSLSSQPAIIKSDGDFSAVTIGAETKLRSMYWKLLVGNSPAGTQLTIFNGGRDWDKCQSQADEQSNLIRLTFQNRFDV